MSSIIQTCIEKGALNKVSVFPNFAKTDLNQLKNQNVRISLHLNLVEGKCMANKNEISMIANQNGNFKHTFIGLFKLNLSNAKVLETEIYKEIKAQVLFWKSILPKDVPFCIDSHQHTHMIPAVFRALIKVLKDEKINLKYMRIPAEPILPFLKTPSLYFTYNLTNIIKQWLLKFLWFINKSTVKDYPVPTAHFFGILFSGKMDKRVNKILPKFQKLSQKSGKDIEVLFHPGYITQKTALSENVVFKDFYLSPNRKIEFDSVINISKGSVQ